MEDLKLILAPMDGVLDGMMREILTSINTYDYAESEFIRIVDRPISKDVLLKKVPELNNEDCCTKSGTPVYIQFLGQDPNAISQSALLAVKMGACGIDLNFGCPAKKVNNSNGGAALLKDPDLIHEICCRVREIVPEKIPVTAKMRLGYENTDNYLYIAEKIWTSGVNALCVHGRTKMDEYLPGTVRWDLIGNIQQESPIPVIANGDIFDYEAAQRCCSVTRCHTLMLGRGALYVPNLTAVVRDNSSPLSVGELLPIIELYADACTRYHVNYFARLKQFLSYIKVHYTEITPLFRAVCHCASYEEALELLRCELKNFEKL